MNLVELLHKCKGIGMLQDDAEALAFLSLIARKPPKGIIEIGSAKGGMFYGLTQLGVAPIISIDLPEGPWGGEGVTAEYRETFKRWSPGVYTLHGNSRSKDVREGVREILSGRKVDLLFIDGDHSSRGSMADFRNYSPLVRKGGLIAFHDIVDSERHRAAGCHVAKTWQKVSKDRRYLEIINAGDWAGIGVLFL